MTRCLLLSCSDAKRHDPGVLPAIERYDGPRYRILRRYLRETKQPDLDVWILSAQFGLIPGDTLIPDYDRVLTPTRAATLRPQIAETLRRVFADHGSAFVVAGGEYVAALARCRSAIPPDARVTVAPGGVGAKNGHLKRWLWEARP